MKTPTAILFAVTLLVCTPAWYSITFQTKYIPPEMAVGLRFFLAGAALEAYRWFKGENQEKLPVSVLTMLICQGIFLFSVNYWLCYESSSYMATGLIAATVSTMIIPNLIFGKIFLQKAISPHAAIGVMVGLLGVFFLFKHDIMNISTGYGSLPGFALAFSSTFLSVIGTILTGKVIARGVSVVYATSRALFIGGGFSIVWSIAKYGVIEIPTNTDFILSMVYLSLFATTLGSLLYTRLIKEIGPGMASYLWIILPTLSLVTSAIFEGYDWTINSTIGIFFITLGGVLVISGGAVLAYIRKNAILIRQV